MDGNAKIGFFCMNGKDYSSPMEVKYHFSGKVGEDSMGQKIIVIHEYKLDGLDHMEGKFC